jgi:hypothetical protein
MKYIFTARTLLALLTVTLTLSSTSYAKEKLSVNNFKMSYTEPATKVNALGETININKRVSSKLTLKEICDELSKYAVGGKVQISPSRNAESAEISFAIDLNKFKNASDMNKIFKPDAMDVIRLMCDTTQKTCSAVQAETLGVWDEYSFESIEGEADSIEGYGIKIMTHNLFYQTFMGEKVTHFMYFAINPYNTDYDPRLLETMKSSFPNTEITEE